MKKGASLNAFTLLETLLVLGVSMVITMAGLRYYQSYAQEQNVAAIQANVQTLFQALDQYYLTSCHNNVPFSADMQDLPANLTSKLVKTSLVGNINNYHVEALPLQQKSQRGERDIYQLVVSVNLDVSSNTADWYQQRLGATRVNGTQLQWIKMPAYTLSKTDSGLWLMNMGLREYKENMLQHANLGSQLQDGSCDY